MKFKGLIFIFSVFILSACKKDNNTENNSGGGNTAITPSEVKIELTFNGQTHIGIFGGFGTSLQLNSAAFEIDESSIALSVATALNVFSAADGLSYASIVLPTAIVNTLDWNTNSSQVFINFFNGTLTIPEPTSFEFSAIVAGTGYGTTGNSTGNWKISRTVESDAYPAIVRCQGEVNITLTNLITNEDFPATIKYVMRFQEPI